MSDLIPDEELRKFLAAEGFNPDRVGNWDKSSMIGMAQHAFLAGWAGRRVSPVTREDAASKAPSDTDREALEQATLYGYQAVWDDGKFDADPVKNAWMWRRVEIAVKAAVERALGVPVSTEIEGKK